MKLEKIASGEHNGPKAAMKTSRLTVFKALLVATMLALFGVALNACSSKSTNASSSGSKSFTVAQPVAKTLTIETGKMDGKSGWPKYVPGNLTVPANTTVTLTITSYDDGAAPLLTGMTQYANVQGGTETVDGAPVTSVPNANVSHTFTVPALGINAVIPAVPSGQTTTTVVFTFKVSKKGTYVWHCYAPCGNGSTGMEGAMATMGWMEGSFVVD
jgi:heme/copper-type cytochrome/quinol oxidase subunit 2